jgi:hypothetical protein
VVLHAFDGSVKVAKKAMAAGYFFSVPPSTCRSPGFQNLVKAVPLELLLLESDAPALSPVIGERNEPANITISCAEIARIKGDATLFALRRECLTAECACRGQCRGGGAGDDPKRTQALHQAVTGCALVEARKMIINRALHWRGGTV